MTLFESIENYRDLKGLDEKKLQLLCQDIRREIIETVTENGGHLSSSLGAVELIVALLRVFDPSDDRIIFDVGHQAYAYKILTGRKNQFRTLRQWGGISGFPTPHESPYDHYCGGHSSVSISAALGYAKARDLCGENHHVVSVIGDGSLVNGVSLEALNNVKETGSKIIIVLNENRMSISRNVGGLADHIARFSVHPAYRKMKAVIKQHCRNIPKGESIEKTLSRIKHSLKHLLQPENMFEDLGISYWGPFDGHDLREMEDIFRLAQFYDKPLLVHVVTKKGKGLEEAEKDPEMYHGLPPRKKDACPEIPGIRWSRKSWSSATADSIEKMASRNERIVCLTAAMKSGSRLESFSLKFPDRFFDVGIAEEHLLSFAAGMAMGGLRPVVFIYSTFLQRALDQLVQDVALQNLPIILAVDRAGLVGEDGPTHHGLFDVAWCSAIPNLSIMAPRDISEMEWMHSEALHRNGPCLIRYPKGLAPESAGFQRADSPGWGQPAVLHEGQEWILFAYGATVPLAFQARESALKAGLPLPAVVDLRFLKPLDVERISRYLKGYKMALVLEEGSRRGGIGEQIASLSASNSSLPDVRVLGVPDVFVPHGSRERQWAYCGLTAERVVSLYRAAKKGTA
ncbi:MAG: 1-deoxy-D-xylulose-5-phosphate synthase [Synergistales bacterium]|nr:1-deoxy-D-xylulose-5-phosphate synthase [Synergistales bacterium]